MVNVTQKRARQMKTYALFAGNNYYPAGGSNDFVGFFATHQEAIDHAVQMERDWDEYMKSNNAPRPTHDTDWWHVAETATMAIVATNR